MSRQLSLYVHWPFCRRICPYCDFNVQRWRKQDASALGDALLSDLTQEAVWRGADWRLESIHFGGGTPSMMPPEFISDLIAEARALFTCAPDLEIALEANPEDIQQFTALATAGINRLTLGVQAFDARRLKRLGRQHSPEDARKAIVAARALFPSLALDIIYATPHQSLHEWLAELGAVLEMTIDHLSLYGLTIEPGTAFGRRPLQGLPDHDLDADMMEQSRNLVEQAGFQHYEVSNYARPHHQSRYNCGVWLSRDYIGIGPGAHGRQHHSGQRFATRKLPDSKAWQQAVLTGHKNYPGAPLAALESLETLSPAAAVQEWLLMGLRLCTGLSLMELPEFLPASITTETVFQALNSSNVFAEMQRDGVFTLSTQRLGIGRDTLLRLDYWIGQLYGVLDSVFTLDSQ
ncbi:MAG: radical SAM family heme chaperone HemW [Alphaproteobacteria bacterium]|nr:radical SAM family heme chaperone HemW [Alphaproteobacteria bacterium]